jgi:hypothetical protein
LAFSTLPQLPDGKMVKPLLMTMAIWPQKPLFWK